MAMSFDMLWFFVGWSAFILKYKEIIVLINHHYNVEYARTLTKISMHIRPIDIIIETKDIKT